MHRWFASAASALVLSGIAAPTQAGAQGWLKKAEEARQRLLAAQAAKDSAAATLRGMRGAKQVGDSGSVVPADADAAEPSEEAARTPRPRGRRNGCMAYNTFQCAASATLGEPLDGAIGGNNPEVFYRFTVDQPGVIRFVLDPMPNNQAVHLAITDAQYNQLGAFNYEGGQPGARLFQVAAPGTYYAHLTGGDFRSQTQPFSFTVARNSRSRPAPPPTPISEPDDNAACSLNNTFQCADEAKIGERVTGAIGGNARQLYYRINVGESGTMEFRLSPMPNRSGVQLTVSDDQYHQLGRMHYPKGQPKGQLLRLAAPGIYYVHLRTGGDAAERFALTVNRQP